MNLNPHSTLAKTSRRLELLQAVADGAVYRVFPLGPSRDFDEWDPGGIYQYQRVTARCKELATHGLIALGPKPAQYKANWHYQLTDAGVTRLREWAGRP